MMNIDKTAMLTGWLMGRQVRGMMKPQEAPASWETIFDGEATTVANAKGYYRADLSAYPTLLTTRTYRVTFNGDVYVLDSVFYPDAGQTLGNRHLQNSEKYEDTGLDFYIGGRSLYTRTPGTYKLKVERQVTA